MPCTIYCARVRHDVTQSPEYVAEAISRVSEQPDGITWQSEDSETGGRWAAGFIAVSPLRAGAEDIYLRVSAITSIHPLQESEPKTETRIVNAINSASVGPRTEFRGKWAA